MLLLFLLLLLLSLLLLSYDVMLWYVMLCLYVCANLSPRGLAAYKGYKPFKYVTGLFPPVLADCWAGIPLGG